ncbi:MULTISPECIES: hypothetical protein [unclassified Campylobacter]|uniref:hypothetical protein n=1 Tax=unclassified Campylobacter TaxID=2593542 RepID=UPI003D350C9A
MKYKILYNCVVGNDHVKQGEILDLSGFDRNYIARLVTIGAIKQIEDEEEPAKEEEPKNKKATKK